nr:hypothetical protein L484_012002 [Ipomoea batatas]
MENFKSVSNPNLTESHSSKSQNPNRIPRHLTNALALELPTAASSSGCRSSTAASIPMASVALGGAIAFPGTKGRTMDRNDDSATKASESKLDESERVEAVAANILRPGALADFPLPWGFAQNSDKLRVYRLRRVLAKEKTNEGASAYFKNLEYKTAMASAFLTGCGWAGLASNWLLATPLNFTHVTYSSYVGNFYDTMML